MRKIMLKAMLKITKWCSRLSYRLSLEKEMEQMVVLSAKIQFKLDDLN